MRDVLFTLNWDRAHAEFYEDLVDLSYPHIWPHSRTAEDLMMACMGCPL